MITRHNAHGKAWAINLTTGIGMETLDEEEQYYLIFKNGCGEIQRWHCRDKVERNNLFNKTYDQWVVA